MPRTNISVVQAVKESGALITYVAADAANGMMFENDGKSLLRVKNADVAAKTVTVVSVPCSHGRTKDTVRSIPASVEHVLGPFPPELFNQLSGTDKGKVYVDFSASTSVTVAAERL